MSPAEPVREPAAERADELLARVEPLPYPARMRTLALHARNERDPLRGALAEALASVRVGLLDGALAEPLEVLAADAVESRDSSAGTRTALRGLADRVLHHGDGTGLVPWALGVYARLVARDGTEQLDGHRLDRVLPRGRERDLLDVLRPHLDTARERGEPCWRRW